MVNTYHIGILIPATSKNFNWDSIEFSYLYKLTIGSFVKTYDPEHQYTIYLGYDEGDSVYGVSEQHQLLLDLVNEYQNLDVKFVSMEGIKKGYVTKMWNRLFNISYQDECDYFYQCGDDIIFKGKGWVNQCILELQKMNDIGVTGIVSSVKGNKKEFVQILTQTFVSRKHKEIFGIFFPPEIKNWYCDNWINMVYTSRIKIISDMIAYNCGGDERYPIVNDQSTLEAALQKYTPMLNSYLKNIKIE